MGKLLEAAIEKVSATIFQLGADTAFASLGGHREAMIDLRELKDEEGILRFGVGESLYCAKEIEEFRKNRPPIDLQRMIYQDRFTTWQRCAFLPHERELQAPPDGTLPRDAPSGPEGLMTGVDAGAYVK